jgi:DNA-binding NtrC family response regulator
MAEQGQMLPDLAFRLTAVRFAIPPLRQRREDISALAQSLLDRICNRYQQRPVVLGPGALIRLLQHDWPGNVRELAAVLETALLEAVNGVIRAGDLALPTGPESSLETQPAMQPALPAENLSLDAVILRHVQCVLNLNRGNKLRSAHQLGHQPLHPLPHPRQRNHPGAVSASEGPECTPIRCGAPAICSPGGLRSCGKSSPRGLRIFEGLTFLTAQFCE